MAHRKEILVHGVPTETWEFDLSVNEIEALLKGIGVAINGVYANLAALQAAFPNGTSGLYQTANDKNIYVWNSFTKKWESLGQLQGPAGSKGTTFTPKISSDGVLSWTNDGNLVNPTPVNIFGRGIKSLTITGTGAQGTYYTFTFTYTDNTTSSFRIYNGKDGNIADTEAAKKAAEDAKKSADAAKNWSDVAKQYSGKPPIPQNGTWWIWDASKQKYVDTGEYIRGNLMYATFYLDVFTGNLYMYTNAEYNGPKFRLNGPDLEVVIHA